jgi:hypothetical protein
MRGFRWHVFVDLRGTFFDSDLSKGWLQSGRVGMQLKPWLHADFGGGRRSTDMRTGLTPDRRQEWVDLSVDWSLSRSVYVSASIERSQDELSSSDQVYVTTSYRF